MFSECPGRGPDEGPLRVLCVDDNPDVADSTADLLRMVGFDARACYGGPAALALADQFSPDVCLIDLNMPGMDGDELAGRLRARGAPAALVAVTAMSSDGCRQRTRAAGFTRHLVKPVQPRELIAAVAELGRRYGPAGCRG